MHYNRLGDMKTHRSIYPYIVYYTYLYLIILGSFVSLQYNSPLLEHKTHHVFLLAQSEK